MANRTHCDCTKRHGPMSVADPVKEKWFVAWKGVRTITIARCSEDADPGHFHFCEMPCFAIWADDIFRERKQEVENAKAFA